VTEARFGADGLRRHAAELVGALGARGGDAERVAAALVDADLCGHRSHGVRQLPYYAGQAQAGEIDVRAELETVLDASGLLVLDGHRGFGQVIAAEACEMAAVRAREHGIAALAVRNAGHIWRLGEYTERLATAGHVAMLLVTAQGADQQIAPHGGLERRLTNNPLSLAVPGPEFPIVLDMALSEVAESRVLYAAEIGAEIPVGWVLDADGQSSTRPEDYLEGGSLVALGAGAGSHKGYSLIVLLELIVGLLASVALCGPASPPFANAFVLIAIDARGAAQQRRPEIAELIAWIKSARRRDGAGEILIPGELEHRRRRAAGDVVALDPVTVAELDDLARQLGIGSHLSGAVTAAPAPARRSRATSLRVLAFHCGGEWSPMGVYDPLDQGGARMVYGPYLMYLVEHAHGRVLFDTGPHTRWKSTRDGRIEVGETDDVVSMLTRAGVTPEEVEHVVVSHLHYDHAGGLRFFPHATVWVQAAELRFAYAPAVYQRELYDRDDFDHPLNWRELDGSDDIFGDDAVTIIPTPGHTPGHQSLCVELPSGPLVLAADASYLDAAMRARRLPGVVWNPDAMVASWVALETLERDRGARLIFTHELEFRTMIELAPEAWYE
jgi:LDH2 family malate/lactate/ureidoglycolate dehydrogenase/glyoxylase-like metal-dependent hydrolase (beta-lactamase superfamily II)